MDRKRLLYSLLAVGLIILVIGLVAAYHNQESPPNTPQDTYDLTPLPPIYPTTTPPVSHYKIAHGPGYYDGYHGMPFSPPSGEGVSRRMTEKERRAAIEWMRNDYTEGYIEGQIDRALDEQYD